MTAIATRWTRMHVLSPMFKLWPRRVLMGLIRVYQSTLGPALPPSCRYEPSCSHYAYAALERHGALRGSWLALSRLVRCQPWGGSGYDPVPLSKEVRDTPEQPRRASHHTGDPDQ